MDIKEITSPEERSNITKYILEALPDWFGIEEAIQTYVEEVASRVTWAIYSKGEVIGMVSIQETSKYAMEIHVMGVLLNYHRNGIGRKLVETAEQYAINHKKKWLIVKTLDSSHPSPEYAQTRGFYLRMGFLPLETLPELWGEENPCLNLIKPLD